MQSQAISPSPDLNGDAFIRQSGLIPSVVPFSSATLWRKVKDGSFPAPVRLSANVTAWRVSDVRAWLQSKQAA